MAAMEGMGSEPSLSGSKLPVQKPDFSALQEPEIKIILINLSLKLSGFFQVKSFCEPLGGKKKKHFLKNDKS